LRDGAPDRPARIYDALSVPRSELLGKVLKKWRPSRHHRLRRDRLSAISTTDQRPCSGPRRRLRTRRSGWRARISPAARANARGHDRGGSATFRASIGVVPPHITLRLWKCPLVKVRFPPTLTLV
jgi:hypothetical protein